MGRRLQFATLAAAGLLLATACGGESLEESDDDAGSGGSGGSNGGGGGGGSVSITGQNFAGTQLMAAMYTAVLEDAGYDVSATLVGTRDLYIDDLGSGQYDVATEYVAGIADFLNVQANGEDAESITTSDAEETLSALEPLAQEAGITLLEPSEAADANAYFVTEEFAQENSLPRLSDLAELGEPVVLAAAPDCEGRPDCEAGLEDVYGIDIAEVLPLGYGEPATKSAVESGEAQLGQSCTSDGTLSEAGFVLLEDDMGIQPAQNLVPAANTEFIEENEEVADLLNEISATLTTEDLAALTVQVDVERQRPEDVATTYLEEEGLL
ncbi:ABC transporter substrate-binding protein [soil metagenome]